MKKENLLMVISTSSVESIMKFPLLYGGVSIPRGYWSRVHIMFWGESIKIAINSDEIRQKVISMKKDGVEFSSCIVCAKDYDAIYELEDMGVICNHTGELLTEALKSDIWEVLTI